MGNYYGIELRKKAVGYVLGGGSQMAAARIFDVDRTTIYRWMKRAESDRLEPIIVHDYVSNKLSMSDLKHYVDTHREDTILEMCCHFGVSYGAVWYKLKKLGYVIKKNDVVQGKKRRKAFRVQEEASKNSS